MKTIENSDFLIKSTTIILFASIIISLIVFFVSGTSSINDINVSDSYTNQFMGPLENEFLIDSTANVDIKFGSDRTDIRALYYYIDFGNAKIKTISPLTNQLGLDYIVVGTGLYGGIPCSDDNVNVSFSLGTFPFDNPYLESLLCIQASTLNSNNFFENGKTIVNVELEFPKEGASDITLYSVSRYVSGNGENISLVAEDTKIFEYNVYSNTTPVCGDQVVDTNEVCDDGNTINGDACSADCSIACDLTEFFDGTSCINPSQKHTFIGNSFIVQAEDFDSGNNFIPSGNSNAGATYFDKNAGFVGNFFLDPSDDFIYRVSDVDIKPIPNTTNEFAIGYSQTGEWLEYTVNIPTTGQYDFYLSAQAPTGESDNLLKLDLDGQTLVPNFNFIPNVDQWNVPKNGEIFTERYVQRINLDSGTKTFRLNIVQEFIDIDYLKFEYVQPETSTDLEIVCGNLDINSDRIVNLIDLVRFIEIFNQFENNFEEIDVLCVDTPFSTNNECGATDFNNDGIINNLDYVNLISKYSSDGSQDCSEI